VVLVHGYGVSSRYFVPLAARLAPTVRVYAPDLPGHGDSESADAPLSVPRLAAALDAWMDAWDLREAVLVGQSMGAQIATELAIRAPRRVAGLVLVAPTVDPHARSARQQIACATCGTVTSGAPPSRAATDSAQARGVMRSCAPGRG
jgi:pimeloyl-ACP methyl ester carboxylesterase